MVRRLSGTNTGSVAQLQRIFYHIDPSHAELCGHYQFAGICRNQVVSDRASKVSYRSQVEFPLAEMRLQYSLRGQLKALFLLCEDSEYQGLKWKEMFLKLLNMEFEKFIYLVQWTEIWRGNVFCLEPNKGHNRPSCVCKVSKLQYSEPLQILRGFFAPF